MKNTTNGRTALAVFGSVLLLALSCTSARAQLTPSFTWTGNGNWSLDAIGSNNTPVGNVLADVPVGSTIVKAYLYSSVYTGSTTVPNVTLGSTTYSGSDWTTLPPDSSV